MEKYDKLIKKWNLHEFYFTKSVGGGGSDVVQMYGDIPPSKAVRLLPECLVDRLLHSHFRVKYDNGSPVSYYDPKTDVATVKSPDDTLHEIGHALWYHIITCPQKKKTVIKSLSNDCSVRYKIPMDDLPTEHLKYSFLVGAETGQFLKKGHPNLRKNDLEEHAARTFDYLIKGKPLVMPPTCIADIDMLLEFYQENRIIDDAFIGFYTRSIREKYNGQGIIRQKIEDMDDGDPLSTELILTIERMKQKELDKAFLGVSAIAQFDNKRKLNDSIGFDKFFRKKQ